MPTASELVLGSSPPQADNRRTIAASDCLGFRVVRIVLGLLLLSTSILKIAGGSAAVTRTVLPFVSPQLYATGVFFEASLGIWLILGIAPAWSWLVSFGFFLLLGYMSFQLGWAGQASCGCAGQIRINPWWAFAIDVLALVSICRWRPPGITEQLRDGVANLVGGLALLLVGAGILSWQYGSINGGMATLQGESVVVEPSVTYLGEGKLGDFLTASIRVVNFGKTAVKIIGGTSDCSLVSTQDLPIELAPLTSREIRVHVKLTGSAGRFRRSFALYADESGLKVIPVVVTGRIVESTVGLANRQGSTVTAME